MVRTILDNVVFRWNMIAWSAFLNLYCEFNIYAFSKFRSESVSRIIIRPISSSSHTLRRCFHQLISLSWIISRSEIRWGQPAFFRITLVRYCFESYPQVLFLHYVRYRNIWNKLQSSLVFTFFLVIPSIWTIVIFSFCPTALLSGSPIGIV